MWQCFFPFSWSLFIFPQPFFPFLTCIRRPVLGPLHAARLYAQGKQTHWLLFFFVLKNGAICKRRVLAVFVSKLLRSVVSASLLFVLSAYKKPQNEAAFFFFLRVCFFFFVFVHTVMSTEAENWKKKRKENHRDKQKSPQKRKQRWCYIEQHHSVRSSSNKQKRWNKKQKKLYHENKNKQQ